MFFQKRLWCFDKEMIDGSTEMIEATGNDVEKPTKVGGLTNAETTRLSGLRLVDHLLSMGISQAIGKPKKWMVLICVHGQCWMILGVPYWEKHLSVSLYIYSYIYLADGCCVDKYLFILYMHIFRHICGPPWHFLIMTNQRIGRLLNYVNVL